MAAVKAHRETLGLEDIKQGVKFCVINPETNYILFGTFTGDEPYYNERQEHVVDFEPASHPGSRGTIEVCALGMEPVDQEADIWSDNITIPW